MTDQTVPAAAQNPQPVAPAPPLHAPSPSLSIISMILGILGLVIGFLGGGLLFSIGAVVLGHLGQRKEQQARALWLTGLVTGYIGILVNLVVIVIWIVVLANIAVAPDMYYDFDRWGRR